MNISKYSDPIHTLGIYPKCLQIKFSWKYRKLIQFELSWIEFQTRRPASTGIFSADQFYWRGFLKWWEFFFVKIHCSFVKFCNFSNNFSDLLSKLTIKVESTFSRRIIWNAFYSKIANLTDFNKSSVFFQKTQLFKNEMKKVSAGLSELHSICPEDFFRRKYSEKL